MLGEAVTLKLTPSVADGYELYVNGENVTQEDAEKAGKRFEAACPDAEVSVLSGGQPVYYYILSME